MLRACLGLSVMWQAKERQMQDPRDRAVRRLCCWLRCGQREACIVRKSRKPGLHSSKPSIGELYAYGCLPLIVLDLSRFLELALVLPGVSFLLRLAFFLVVLKRKEGTHYKPRSSPQIVDRIARSLLRLLPVPYLC